METEKNMKPEQALAPYVNNLLPLSQTEDDEPKAEYIIITSGFCKPNPHGIGAWGAAIFDDNGKLLSVHYGSIGSGEGVTNMAAAYVAVLNALGWAAESAPYHLVEILTDSELVAKQVSGEWSCNEPHLKELRDEAVKLFEQSMAFVRWAPKAETEIAALLAKLGFLIAKRELERGGDD